MADPNNADSNHGFAFLEIETNRDAQIAYKKLQKKDALGKGRNIKVAWAEPLNDPDKEEIKSVYVEGIPLSWNEDKVRESFKKFGEIERIILARNIPSARRKDFAFVNYTMQEAVVSRIKSFDKEEITKSGSKANLKVSLAKPVQKGKQNKGGSKSSNKDREAQGSPS
ncbi:RNA-binding protein 47-like [Phoenix dactylifera]|uniref:RNA-binding protein 47-like n=1 Tax=Phoenix dactylifera TaxID=42345 RepID=A0A8B8ZSB3_PHODC|nr:RNA-binding protein 47-like [Phoenix dactylifera]